MKTRPDFIDSPYFVPEVGNWHLKPGAPPEVVKEFEEWMAEEDFFEDDEKRAKGGE